MLKRLLLVLLALALVVAPPLLAQPAQPLTNVAVRLDGEAGGVGDIKSVAITTTSPLTGTATCLSGACSFTLGLGVVPATLGGTGQSAFTIGDVLYASSTTAISKLGIGSAAQCLVVTGGIPAWGACGSISQLSYSSNVLSLSNGASHQAMRIYYANDGAGNAEWLNVTSNDGIYSAYNIAAAASGAGVTHTLIIGSTGPAVSVDPSDDGYLLYSGSNWFFWRSGIFGPTTGASNAADLGIASTNLWRTGYFGTSVVSPLFVGIVQTSGTTPAVANTTANSCGTTAATIAGNDAAGVVTVGATAGTICRITFVTAATTRRVCSVSNESTANLARTTYVDTTHSDLKGTFVAGDVLAYQCSTY